MAIVVDWFKNPMGSADFLGTLKRAIIATILVVSFQEISNTILELADGLAMKIGDLSGTDTFLKMAGEKASTYTFSVTSAILGFNDLVIAILSFLSYIVLFIARYVTVAIYHFMWSMDCAPRLDSLGADLYEAWNASFFEQILSC